MQRPSSLSYNFWLSSQPLRNGCAYIPDTHGDSSATSRPMASPAYKRNSFALFVCSRSLCNVLVFQQTPVWGFLLESFNGQPLSICRVLFSFINGLHFKCVYVWSVLYISLQALDSALLLVFCLFRFVYLSSQHTVGTLQVHLWPAIRPHIKPYSCSGECLHIVYRLRTTTLFLHNFKSGTYTVVNE